MPTVIAPKTVDFPYAATRVRVYIKREWGDEWNLATALRPHGITLRVASVGVSEATISLVLGEDIHAQGVAGLHTYRQLRYAGRWLRIRATSDEADETIFLGRFRADTREVQGKGLGVQTLTAYSLEHSLERAYVWRSYWTNDRTVDWFPGFNMPDDQGCPRGTKSTSSALFGDEDRWSAADIVAYIMETVLPIVAPELPQIPYQLPNNAARVFPTIRPGVYSVADLLRAALSPKHGLDWSINPGRAGVEPLLIGHVLHPRSVSSGGLTLPGATNTTTISIGETHDEAAVTIERNDAVRYRRVRAVGARDIVVSSPAMVRGWDDTLQTEYDDATDAERADDRFRHVYRTLLPSTRPPGATQDLLQSTLSFLPIRAGQVKAAGLVNPPTEPGELLPIAVWLRDENNEYQPADQLGFGVAPLVDQWGVHIQASPNHSLGLDTFNGDSATASRYDYRAAVVTLAIRADSRAEAVAAISSTDGDEGAELVIEVPAAERWIIAANTVIGYQGATPIMGPATELVLTSDDDALTSAAAGAASVHLRSAIAATISWHLVKAWAGDLLGSMLNQAVEEDGTTTIGAPVTSVRYDFDQVRTTISTGGAA